MVVFWQGRGLRFWFYMACLFVCKLLRLPPAWFAAPERVYLLHWSRRMFLVYLASFGRRTYMDQPCSLPTPENLAPRSTAGITFKLSEDEHRSFYENGFIGPYRVLDTDEAFGFCRHVMRHMRSRSKVYGFPSVRDRHLDSEKIEEVFCRPQITDRVAQLIGDDPVCWRSQVFLKPPGGEPIAWHQASTYLLEDGAAPALEPPNRNTLFQVTVWIALTAATAENGCLEIIPGSHRRIRTISRGGESRFYAAPFKLDLKNTAEARKIVLEPGEFVIFTERAVHGSGPNATPSPRVGINFRAVSADVAVYRGKTQQVAIHHPDPDHPVYNLSRWRPRSLRHKGEPQSRRPLIVTPRHATLAGADRDLINKEKEIESYG